MKLFRLEMITQIEDPEFGIQIVLEHIIVPEDCLCNYEYSEAAFIGTLAEEFEITELVEEEPKPPTDSKVIPIL